MNTTPVPTVTPTPSATDKVAIQAFLHTAVTAVVALIVPAAGGFHLAAGAGALVTAGSTVLGGAVQLGRNLWAIGGAQRAAHLEAKARAEAGRLEAAVKSIIGAPAYGVLDAAIHAEEPKVEAIVEKVLAAHGLSGVVSTVAADTKDVEAGETATVATQVVSEASALLDRGKPAAGGVPTADPK